MKHITIDRDKTRILIFPLLDDGSRYVAEQIATTIRSRQANGNYCVLGLATGATPKKIYAHLIAMHRNEGLSFRNVVTFNLDEYFPMRPEHQQSYARFMRDNLFNHIDIDFKNVHMPNGTIDAIHVHDFCQRYEQQIVSWGGIDLQILGIGRTGHIGFNEPGSPSDSETRLVSLDPITRKDAVPGFGCLEAVPTHALTMGIKTIMQAKRIILMAWGVQKAPIVKRTLDCEITEMVPASFLRQHDACSIVLDRLAAMQVLRTANGPQLNPRMK
ncbi:glucosamine-6-phosphate deaminase [Chryseolinea lacunae]|uniref:Glucosamine-6-phosphate deaminase n=1 Tax=Chryseolinea lacunae TaxID=2801331 RepID=A0ABS1L257_9BACT|nr:glucosamine-6-phosphate deaminase [Chryseolinea lacunae]